MTEGARKRVRLQATSVIRMTGETKARPITLAKSTPHIMLEGIGLDIRVASSLSVRICQRIPS